MKNFLIVKEKIKALKKIEKGNDEKIFFLARIKRNLP